MGEVDRRDSLDGCDARIVTDRWGCCESIDFGRNPHLCSSKWLCFCQKAMPRWVRLCDRPRGVPERSPWAKRRVSMPRWVRLC